MQNPSPAYDPYFDMLLAKILHVEALTQVGVEALLLESRECSNRVVNFFSHLAEQTTQAKELCEQISLKQRQQQSLQSLAVTTPSTGEPE